jgi:prepilin-type N-terminal cleavage/methylation domain-containing protein
MIRRNRRGFTIVELMVVIVVIAILVGMMVMRYTELKDRAIAAQATADMDNVRIAAYSEFYDTGQWPSAPGPGVVPPELVPYLGVGFSFNRSDYKLEFENFVPVGGGSTPTYQVAIRFTSANQNLVNTMAHGVGRSLPYLVLGNDVAVILVGPDGQF